MYEGFGEFASWEEINKAAEGLKNEGDLESLRNLAKENGLEEDAEDYIDGYSEQLCTPLLAAVGKIEVETEEMEPKGLMQDWVDYLKATVTEDEQMALAVRRSGKSLAGMMAALLKWSFTNQQEVPKEIIKAAKINAAKVTFGIPGMRKAKEIIRTYYLGGDAE